MTILGSGDLAPRRRSRHRRSPYVVALLVLALAAGGGWYGWRAWHDTAPPGSKLAFLCVTPVPEASPAPVKQVKVAVLNGTTTVGLAHIVAGTLTRRGFAIVKVGNGTAATGAPRIAYAPGEIARALTLAEQVPGATLYELSTQRPGQVELRISTGFKRLATLTEAKAARDRDLAATSPSPAPCSTPTP